jgi:ABC-type nitrate/sulfonate/bicarbonate transport system ATPase subunit
MPDAVLAGAAPEAYRAPAAGLAPKIVVDRVTKIYRTRRRRDTFLGRFLPDLRPQTMEVKAVDNVSLEISAGDFVAIIGPSGCGKTTVLRMMDGLIFPDGGRVLVNGSPVVGPRAECGFIFQDFGLYPWRNVIDNAAFGPELRGVPKAARHELARRHIDLVGLKGFEWAFPHQLSGGMQQRVGIARMLSAEPEIMLMDEPFGALDALTRRTMQFELIRILAAEGSSTSVFVTHDLDEALLLADKVVIMSARPGRVKEVVPVPFSRSERGEALLETSLFAELRHHLWLGVHEEAAA